MLHTLRFQRVLRAPADRVFRAFIDPDAMAKWLPPHGFTGRVHEMDACVGGGYRMSFTNLANGQSHSFGGRFVELVPNERIRHTDRSPQLQRADHAQAELSSRRRACRASASAR